MQEELLSYPNISVVEGKVGDVIIQEDFSEDEQVVSKGRITGVRLESGEVILTNHVVITTGTFLEGEIHIGGSTNYTQLFNDW